jgi:hypothetical protein
MTTPCVISLTNTIRNLLFECQSSISTQFNVPEKYLTTISGIQYVMIPVDSNSYKRKVDRRSTRVDTFSSPFIAINLATVSFSATVVNELWCIRQCLEFLATSSISTSYTRFIPVTCLDYVRPEIMDGAVTVRKGILTLADGQGTSGTNQSDLTPLATTSYELMFEEVTKRLVM